MVVIIFINDVWKGVDETTEAIRGDTERACVKIVDYLLNSQMDVNRPSCILVGDSELSKEIIESSQHLLAEEVGKLAQKHPAGYYLHTYNWNNGVVEIKFD